MKPVEIEILMKDSLTAGLDRGKMSVEQLLGVAKRASAAISSEIRNQQKVIDGVCADLGRMENRMQGMKPGPGQRELTVEIAACRKLLGEETAALGELEKQHRSAQEDVSRLEQEYRRMAAAEGLASAQGKSLTERIAEQKTVVKLVEEDVKALEKAYKGAAPGKAQGDILAELNAAKKALQEDKAILASLTEEQDRNAASTKRLSMQLREMQDTMARMRMNGERNTDEYRRMSDEAAQLADTIADLRQQTSILADDDANLKGFASGINGLSGAFTAATGVMSVFAGENENLMKIQTRVQGVMAVTMGLQQMFNALNKDSAFRLVTVARAKELLTAANMRLAAALGISTGAAQALMATLTLGLSVVVTGLIVAWNRLADAQDAAAAKTQEMIEIESDGRAQMIKTRFELDNTIREIKMFNGTKEEEGKKVEELNRKWGETFGYCDTLAGWYDTLTEKSEQYIRMLFLQAKAQSLVNKAVEKDEELNKMKAQSPDEADSSMGWFQRLGLYTAQSESHGRFNASKAIDEYNRKEYDKAIRAKEKERDDLLKEAERLTTESAGLGNGSGIGGHTRPDRNPPHGNNNARGLTVKEEQRLHEELMELLQRNVREENELRQDGLDKQISQIKQEYEVKLAETDRLERKWREAQNGDLSKEQQDAIDVARDLARQKAEAAVKAARDEDARLEQERLDASLKAWQDYLIEYGDYEEKRQATAEKYAGMINRAETEGERRMLQEQLKSQLKELNFDEFKAGIDFAEVFGRIDSLSTAALTVLRNKLKEYINSAARDLKPDDLKSLQEAFDRIDIKLTERNPYASLQGNLDDIATAYSEVAKARADLNTVTSGGEVVVEEYADEAGKTVRILLGEEEAERRLAAAESRRYAALSKATDSLHAGVAHVREYGESVHAVIDMLGDFGVEIPEELNTIAGGLDQVLGGLENIDLTKPASVITGMVKTLAGLGKTLAGVLSLGGIDWGGTDSIRRYESAKAKYESYMAVLDKVIGKQKELVATMDSTDYLNAENSYEYAKSLLNKSEEAARNLGRQYLNSGASSGFLGIGSSASKGREQREDISNEGWAEYDSLMGKMSRLAELGLSVDDLVAAASGRMTGLFDLTSSQLEWIMEQAPTFWAELHEDTRKYLEEIIACGDEWNEIESARRESLTNIAFDDFYSSWLKMVSDVSSDVKDLADMMEEDFSKAILNSMMKEKYKDQLQALYNEWADMTESDGRLDETEIEILRRKRDQLAEDAIRERNGLASAFGWNDNRISQSGKAGGFAAMSQDQGTKLEGLFVSGLMHWSSIDDKMDDIADGMNMAQVHLKQIAENTGACRGSLADIVDDLKVMMRDGVKVK